MICSIVHFLHEVHEVFHDILCNVFGVLNCFPGVVAEHAVASVVHHRMDVAYSEKYRVVQQVSDQGWVDLDLGYSGYSIILPRQYHACVQDATQVMERSYVAPKQNQLRPSNQQLLTFPPFPVGHPAHEPNR